MKDDDGSTRRLLELCAGYFLFYVVTGVTVKYFEGSAAQGFPGMSDVEFSTYSTVGGSGLCLAVVLARRWFRVQSNRLVRWGPFEVPSEYAYIIPSGVCTAVIIPTTTLMYSLPISVMVAMVIMRGSVIVISRAVDAVQLRQGILKKSVYPEENIAVVFALLAVAVAIVANVLSSNAAPSAVGASGPAGVAGVARAAAAHARTGDALSMTAGMFVLGSYVTAYAVRIYIMNYYKNTRGRGVKLDNQGFFGVEQLAASVVLLLVGAALFAGVARLGWHGPHVGRFHGAIAHPRGGWSWAVVAGMAFGMVSFFSVFIFMFKGRTATFAGLVNRLTSLIAGTAATLVFHFGFGGKAPRIEDWASLAFILIAVGFLTRAERKRAAESAAPARTGDADAPPRAA